MKIRMDKTHQQQNAQITWQELWKSFEVYNKTRGLSKMTMRNYETCVLDKFIGWVETQNNLKYVQDLNQAKIYEYIGELQEEYDNGHTMNYYIGNFRTFIYFAREDGYLNFTPKVSLMATEERIKDTYSPEELKRLLVKPNVKECRFAEYRNWAIVNFLIGTGVRRRTLLAMNIEDLDFQNRLITLNVTKTKKSQVVPMANTLAKVLREYLSYREGTGKDPLFCTSTGERIKYYSIHKAVTRYNNKRGVDKTSIHLFRHTFAKLAIKNGIDPIRLQKLLGHSSLDMTQKYTNMFGTDLQENYNDYSPLESVMRT